jgi:hypothetical protein
LVVEGTDQFETLRMSRRETDPVGVRLGVAGALRNAWASGMQRDTGEGRAVYLTRSAVVLDCWTSARD